MMPTHTAQDPVARFLASRSEKDFEALVEKLRPYVFKIALRVLLDRHHAADVASEVFALVHRGRVKTPVCRDGRALLAALTTRRAFNRLRREWRLAERQESYVRRMQRSEVSSGEGLSVEDLWEIREAVESLPEPLREVVELRFYGALSVASIARIRGIAEVTAEKHVSRAIGTLRRRLQPAAFGAVSVALLGTRGKASALGSSGGAVGAGGASIIGLLSGLLPWRSAPWGKSIAAAALLAGGITVGLLQLGGTRTDGEIAEVSVATAPNRPEPTPVARVEARPRAPVVSRPTPLAAAPASAEKPRAAPLVAAPASLPEFLTPPSVPFAVIEVVDEEGQLVREGELALSLNAWLTDPVLSLQDRVVLWITRHVSPAGAQATYSLARENPVRVPWISPLCWGTTLKARAALPGHPEGPPATFIPQREETAALRVLAQRHHDLTVVVKDAATQEPLPNVLLRIDTDPIELAKMPFSRHDPEGVELSLLSLAGITGQDGKLVLKKLRPRDITLELTRMGYIVATQHARGTEGELLVELEPVKAEPPGSLTIEVLDRAGRPWPGCELALRCPSGMERRFRTGDDGRLTTPGAAPGEYLAEVSSQLTLPPLPSDDADILESLEKIELRCFDDYLPLRLTVRSGVATRVVLKAEPPPGKVRLRLLGEDGEPLARVSVAVGQFEGKTRTDGAGEALLDGPSGVARKLDHLGRTDGRRVRRLDEADVNAFGEGCRVELARVVVPPGKPMEVEVTVPDTILEGRVMWEDDDEGLVGARVEVLAPGRDPRTGEAVLVQKARAIALLDGYFRVPYLPRGVYTLRVDEIVGPGLVVTPLRPTEVERAATASTHTERVDPRLFHEIRVRRDAKTLALGGARSRSGAASQ